MGSAKGSRKKKDNHAGDNQASHDQVSDDSHGHGGHGEVAGDVIPEKSVQDSALIAIAGIALLMLVWFGYQLSTMPTTVINHAG